MYRGDKHTGNCSNIYESNEVYDISNFSISIYKKAP
jgi:hypothetical protein